MEWNMEVSSAKQTRTRSTDSSSDSGIDSMPDLPERQGSGLDPEVKKVQTEAIRAMLEILMKTPESLPFRHNPRGDSCKSRGRCLSKHKQRILKKVTLDKIYEKVKEGKYEDPWDYISDMNLLFKNAEACNSTGQKMYNCSVRLHRKFESEMNRLMREHGYCCGQHESLTPQKLVCLGKDACMISVGEFYFSYQNKYLYCESCFSRIPGKEVSLSNADSKNGPSIVPKSEFSRERNDKEENERFVRCMTCSRRFHEMCVLHLKEISPKGFYCESCFWQINEERKERAFTAKSLPTSKLSIFIEKKVNEFLVHQAEGSKRIYHVIVRVLGSFDRVVEVKPELKHLYPEKFSNSFPYRAKTIFVFQNIEGVDVCVFAFMTQEYGSDCPEPNRRRVYLSYLDSVQYFRPKESRTAVFHQILLRYLEYVKSLGFLMVHIWSCPPTDNDDYIFHRHPHHQKVPTAKRLCQWYRTLLDKGIEEGILVEYKSYLEQVHENNLTSIAEMPYFEGDHWPSKFEEMIKETRKERGQKCSRTCFPETASPRKRKKTRGRPKSIQQISLSFDDHLWKKVCKEMTQHKDIFFNVRLNPSEYVPNEIVDPDLPHPCPLLENRDHLLTLARDNRFEFTTLRRAKYLTLVILFNLHRLAESNCTYNCSMCHEDITLVKRYHFSQCEMDFCVDCFKKTVVSYFCPHCTSSCEKVGFDEGEAEERADCHASLEDSLDLLKHAVNCKYKYCNHIGCIKIKMCLHHLLRCSNENSFAPNDCKFCFEAVNLICQHVSHCSCVYCGVTFCGDIKLCKRLDEYSKSENFLNSDEPTREEQQSLIHQGEEPSAKRRLVFVQHEDCVTS